MRRRSMFSILAIAGFFVLSGFASAQESSRVALIIGNTAYRSVPSLPNAANDAVALSSALREHRFAVTTVVDARAAELRARLRAFRALADRAEIALVYYSGHGIEVGGENYLIPVDARLLDERDIRTEAIALEYILDEVSGASRLNMVVLDACRNNPFIPRMNVSDRSRGIGRGLAAVSSGRGKNLVIAYAAAEGDVTPDGEPGKTSPFTAAFLEALAGPPKDVGLLLRTVRDGVQRRLGPAARPFVYSSLGPEEIVLNIGSDPHSHEPDGISPSIRPDDLEAALVSLGYLDADTDDMTAGFSAALRLFQWDHDLPATGRLDASTAARLRVALRMRESLVPAPGLSTDPDSGQPPDSGTGDTAASPTEPAAGSPEAQNSTLSPPSQDIGEPPVLDREKIRRVQAILLALGHDPNGVDGIMGPATRAAIRSFQRSLGEEETGRLTTSQMATLEASGRPPFSNRNTGENSDSSANTPLIFESGDVGMDAF